MICSTDISDRVSVSDTCDYIQSNYYRCQRVSVCVSASLIMISISACGLVWVLVLSSCWVPDLSDRLLGWLLRYACWFVCFIICLGFCFHAGYGRRYLSGGRLCWGFVF